MQTKANRLINTDAVDERTLKPVVKLLLLVGALFLMWALVTNLPGVDALIPETAVTYGAVLGAAVTLGIVAVLLFVALRLEPLVVQAFAGPREVVSDIASMAKHVVLFVAVITAHSGLTPLVMPSLEAVDLAWTYDMLFLVLALIPTVVIAIRMYGNFDEVATLLTGRMTSSESEESGDDTSEPRSSH
ncbi:MAG: hypothetical protein ABEH78_09820 [Haloferacaceae archaeon]